MIVSTTAPLPHNSLDPPSPARQMAFYARKQRTFSAVASAASRYNCSAPVASFPGLGLNFQMQVQRAINLLNSIGQPLTAAQSTGASRSTGTGGAPTVVPFNPVQLTPNSQDPPAQGPFDAPDWGNYSGEWPVICSPLRSLLDSLQAHPGWALGGLAAVALAAGAFGSKRRNPGRRRR